MTIALGAGTGQASVNPKAETVDELQGRRKTLHLGMCKLGRQDLSLGLQRILIRNKVAPGHGLVKTLLILLFL